MTANDGATESGHKKVDMLEDLAAKVTSMASVFADANAAREEERAVLRQKHSNVLSCIEDTKNDVIAEAARLKSTIESYEAKTQYELEQLRKDMLALLETKHSTAMDRIEALEVRCAEVEKALVDEIEERKKNTEEVLGMLQHQVDEISAPLSTETVIRKQNHEVVNSWANVLEKKLSDSIEDINKQLDEEKFKRDVLCTRVEKDMSVNHEEITKRQLKVQRWTHDLVNSLHNAINSEEALRGASQDSIIESISTFIRRFQEDIREEARMMTA
ncbi:hypothetical protein FOL47_009042 [Perkinsus chesapeaki]|uniref:Uncharacterized protein n=1 Tax=Perkinsus chesapeaki TaxID=330153 RepID=A0A7J6LAN8_PERCH|nr:hypothetical protein FOL47_009042 [Perkinsus chesapeaki]